MLAGLRASLNWVLSTVYFLFFLIFSCPSEGRADNLIIPGITLRVRDPAPEPVLLVHPNFPPRQREAGVHGEHRAPLWESNGQAR